MNVTDKITITNEDNMLLMARYPDNYFDLAIVDPPYGIGEDGGKSESRCKKTKVKPNNYKKKSWDTSAPNKDYFNELQRVSKNQIIWGANHFIENIKNSNSSCWIVWDKDNGENDFADCELAYCSFNTAVRKIRYKWHGMLQEKMGINKEKRLHPTQKPVALYKWILDKYAKQGDKILDTHLGSGSIAIAAHDYGFELTCCELDTEYYDKAIQRIKNHVSQQKLF
jgi:site-specific DNA-methyltransferase (adenine-specific)